MSESQEFTVGDRVRVVALPPYVKTAEPMPMLRPPNVISLGEEGIVINRRPGGFWSVRFSQGMFLMDTQYLELASASSNSSTPDEHILEHPSD
ncbi:DUF3148 domain-containing protein [Leptolyngbya sp. FACHB-671]|uniref:regulatory protein SipA n=1 Tax=Leptolyngbya sp. FACHB-671 TaxID=2692812 RepID=UPI00168346CB|nr:DUF3148 domain-containing protein [Leptolyngbya sp. FACHB-671]MBD2069870.1 DUF3148 domain-containing protein [Leptolyngbya sp. FACHB-671]